MTQRSGILAFQVHQIEGLECMSGYYKPSKEKEKEQSLPSSYVNVFLNDEKVFQTRTKAFSGGESCRTLRSVLLLMTSRSSVFQRRERSIRSRLDEGEDRLCRHGCQGSR